MMSVCFRLEGIQYPYHLYISPSARASTNGPDRPFQCPTCGVRFTRIQNLKQHMLIHSGTSRDVTLKHSVEGFASLGGWGATEMLRLIFIREFRLTSQIWLYKRK